MELGTLSEVTQELEKKGYTHEFIGRGHRVEDTKTGEVARPDDYTIVDRTASGGEALAAS